MTESERLYCRRCGTRLTTAPGYGFDEHTGEPLTQQVCRKCYPCDHEWELVPMSWWQQLISGRLTRCKKCGFQKAPSNYYEDIG